MAAASHDDRRSLHRDNLSAYSLMRAASRTAACRSFTPTNVSPTQHSAGLNVTARITACFRLATGALPRRNGNTAQAVHFVRLSPATLAKTNRQPRGSFPNQSSSQRALPNRPLLLPYTKVKSPHPAFLRRIQKITSTRDSVGPTWSRRPRPAKHTRQRSNLRANSPRPTTIQRGEQEFAGG